MTDSPICDNFILM